MKTVVAVARWETVPGESIEAYWERLREAGLDPLDLGETGQGPSTGSGRRLADCDGLVLTGGVDIDPARYGESPHERVRRTDPRRDEFEAGLLEAALAADLPVLAICRGHQLLNVALGGSLHQHIEGGAHAADYRSDGAPSRSHAVELAEGSRLRAWLGADALSVNSRHHQAVTPERLAPGLQVAALSADGYERVATRCGYRHGSRPRGNHGRHRGCGGSAQAGDGRSSILGLVEPDYGRGNQGLVRLSED